MKGIIAGVAYVVSYNVTQSDTLIKRRRGAKGMGAKIYFEVIKKKKR